MQSLTNLNQVLKSITELSVEEQFYVADILSKRLIETRRSGIVDRIREAEENYRQGNVYSGDVSQLMLMTEND